MAKDDRSGVNPFTGKKHFDIVKGFGEFFRSHLHIFALRRRQHAHLTAVNTGKIGKTLESAHSCRLADIVLAACHQPAGV